MAELRVLIAGGGTGGHIIPALAVARELVERQGAEVLFVGTARGLEVRLVPEAGFRLRLVDVGQLKNVSLSTRLRTLSRLPGSIVDCRRLIREFRPGAVLGVGGYASGPAMAAALWLKIPAMAFEPNAMPGLANRLVGKRVQAAAINFPAAAKWFRNAEVTGVPVRLEFFSLQPPTGDPHLLIFGGSLGARIFNTYLPQLLPALLCAVPGLTVLHQSGARNAAATEAAYAATGADPSRWQVSPFLDDMPKRFARAHLVMSRSGASTVAELAAAGKPALLVPFAAAADEHQRRNAEAMVAAGAAVMLEEKDLEIPEKLLAALIGLLTTPARLAAMATAARTQAHPGAAERIAYRLANIGFLHDALEPPRDRPKVKVRRPLGVKLIGAYLLLKAAFLIAVVATAHIHPMVGPQADSIISDLVPMIWGLQDQISGIMLAPLFALVDLVLGLGIWYLQKWARTFIVVDLTWLFAEAARGLLVLPLISRSMIHFHAPPPLFAINVVADLMTLGCLLDPDVRRAFRASPID